MKLSPEDIIEHRKQKPFCYRNEQGYHINYFLEGEQKDLELDEEKLKAEGFYIYEYRKDTK